MKNKKIINTTKVFQAWTMGENRIGQDYTEMKAASKKDFRKWMKDNKRKICSPIWTKYISQ